MDKIRAFMHYQIIGVQVWAYLAFVLAPFVLNEIVQRSKSTFAMSLFQFAMRILLKIPALGTVLAAIPGLGAALHKMAGDTTGLPPTFKQRRANRLNKIATKVVDAPKPPDASPPVAPTVAILLIGLMSLTGCGFCSVAANKNTARCKAQNVATDCAAPEVIKIGIDILGSVSAALVNNDYSKLLDIIVADVVKAGRADGLGVVLCAIEKIKGQPSANDKTSTLVAHANAYIEARK